MSDRVLALETEVAELREEIESQKGELQRLRKSFAGLRAEVARGATPAPLTPPQSAGYETYSEDSYSVVSEVHLQRREGPVPVPSSSVTAHIPTVAPRSPSSAGSQAVVLSWASREAIADEIGHFLARCIRGGHRGTSGRDKNPLGSRVWICARDHSGQIYTPVRVFRSWSSCKLLCKPNGQDPGDSVFVGVPSEREAKRAVLTAGLTWPDVIEA